MWTELVLGAVPEQGDRPAVTDVRTGEVVTFAAFERRVTHAAAGLRRRGLRTGDRVIVDLPPGAALPLAVHAVAWAGGVVVCPNTDSTARMMITQSKWEHTADEVRQVFTMEPTDGASLFTDLLRGQRWEFGPISGPAVDVGGGRVLTDGELVNDLRAMAARGTVRRGDVVLAAITDRPRLVRLIDVSLMVGARVIIAHDPTLIGCRVLAEEHRATVVVAQRDLARRLGSHPGRRVVEETVLSSRHASCA